MVGLRATVLGRLGSLTPNQGGGRPISPIARLYGPGCYRLDSFCVLEHASRFNPGPVHLASSLPGRGPNRGSALLLPLLTGPGFLECSLAFALSATISAGLGFLGDDSPALQFV